MSVPWHPVYPLHEACFHLSAFPLGRSLHIPFLLSPRSSWLPDSIPSFAPLLQSHATLSSPSRVIITASVAGIGVGSLGESATFGYSASKAAAIHLARNLAVDLGPRHIITNAIAPGFFPTKMANGLMELQGGAEKLAAEVPDGRLGEPEDIAGLVVFLASRASKHVNGACITVDGGSVWGRTKL